jgi:SOS regulatory protein LexA
MSGQLNNKLITLKQFFHRYKRLPSYSELLKLWRLSSKNAVFKHIQKLIQEKYLCKDKFGKIAPTTAFFSLNLYGSVPAGFPVPTPDEQADLMSLEEYLIDSPNKTFLLKVSGDSLIEAGILPNDLVLIEKTNISQNGQIVLANVDSEWTLKILEKTKTRVRLIPANKNYQPIVPKNELLIYGVVKGVVRKY